jgi:WXG100 family type VII secretion target
MGDKVGASPQAMANAVTNFNNRYNEFIAAAQNITSDTLALQAAWQGQGYDEFTTAMGKWNTDITNVTTDLQSMSLGVQNSSGAIQGTDQNIARAFRSYHG